MQDFRNLAVWRKAHELAVAVYAATADFPNSERFGLTSQMRRAAVSIAANIAEGSARDGDADTKRFLQISLASAAELHAELLLARDLMFVTAEHSAVIETKIIDAKRMLSGLINRIRSRL